jgi:hypothetical protein
MMKLWIIAFALSVGGATFGWVAGRMSLWLMTAPIAERCDDLGCLGLTCGSLTPRGDVRPSVCTCVMSDRRVASCEAP